MNSRERAALDRHITGNYGEDQFIQREQAKQNANLLRQLRLVVKDPFAPGKRTIETLLVNGLIEFGGPSETCQYNHYRLTDAGKRTLEELSR